MSVDAKGSRVDKQSSAYILKSLLAGGFAGSVAKTVIAPFDRIKILFQANNPKYKNYAGSFSGVFKAAQHIISDKGISALFQGHTITIVRIFPYAAIKFMSYEQYKTWLMPEKASETWWRRLAAGSLAGTTSVFATYPLDVIRVRMAYEVEGKPTVKGAVRTIWHEAGGGFGLGNFYRGFFPTVYGMIPYAGVSFWTYETLYAHLSQSNWHVLYNTKMSPQDETRSRDRAQGNKILKPWVTLTIGGIAGAVAQTISYPFDIIRRRMQVAGVLPGRNSVPRPKSPLEHQKNYSTTWKTINTIYKQSGFKGFFVGLSIGYLKVTPMVATSFFVYDYAKRQLGI